MEVVNISKDQLQWCPISHIDDAGNTGDIYYVGQLVKQGNMGNGTAARRLGDGVQSARTAAGTEDTTNEAALVGIIVATNNRDRVIDATYGVDSITSVVTQTDQVARVWSPAGGNWAYGDPQPMVQIARISAQTRIKAYLYNSTYGTAPTVQTVTTGSTDGLGYTANACDFTPVEDLASAYCRSGANRGIIRITDDASTTVATCDRAFPYDIAIGDTFVRVPLRPFGLSYVQTDTEALFFDVSASPATNYWVIHVHELNLAEAGREYVIFNFDPIHFSGRATWV